MGFGFANGRVDDHFAGGNGVDGFGDAFAFSFFGEVDRLAAVDVEQVALHHVLAVGAGVEHATALHAHFVQAAERAGGDAFDGHIHLQVFQGLADRLVGFIGPGNAAAQGDKGSSNNSGGAHWILLANAA
jgi:hypothetical protein